MIGSIQNVGAATQMMRSQQMRPNQQEMFQRADSNGDNSIDKAEFANTLENAPGSDILTANIDDIFSMLDTNADGVLNQSEADESHALIADYMQSQHGLQKPTSNQSNSSKQFSTILTQAMESYQKQSSNNIIDSSLIFDILG